MGAVGMSFIMTAERGWELTRYLVTGGAGFIGSHLAAVLLERGHEVRVVDDLTTGMVENLPDGVEFVEGDLVDPATAGAAVRGCEVVLHQAAIPSVPRSISEPRPSHAANIDGTFNILLAARDAGVRRLVYAASSSAYGDTLVLPKVEDMPTNPRSPYALQKLVGETYCQLFTRLYGLETVAIRYFNVFGPRQHPTSPYSGVLSLFIKAALSGTSPTVHGDGEQTRDFTFIDNVVDGVLRAVDAPGAAGEVLNVACGGRISLNQAWAGLESIVGPLAVPTYGPPRPGDVRDSQADISKAARLLGYRPTVSFEEGLRLTVDWVRDSQ
jgi:UDP-glucose 4-epimerase